MRPATLQPPTLNVLATLPVSDPLLMPPAVLSTNEPVSDAPAIRPLGANLTDTLLVSTVTDVVPSMSTPAIVNLWAALPVSDPLMMPPAVLSANEPVSDAPAIRPLGINEMRLPEVLIDTETDPSIDVPATEMPYLNPPEMELPRQLSSVSLPRA